MNSEVTIYRRRLIILFFTLKACLFSLAFLSALLIHPYNPSIGLILFPKSNPHISLLDLWMKRLLRPFASWDGVYFMTISMKGYIFEQEHAFFPLYPLLVRCLADYVLGCASRILSLPARCIMSAVFISNACHFVSTMVMFQISLVLFEDTYYAYLSAAFMGLATAQAVMSAAYSESLFTCLCMLGLLAFYRKHRADAAVFWCLAGATRSNGIFMPGFFLYEFLHKLRHYSDPTKVVLRSLQLLTLLMISWTGFFTVLYYGWSLYCCHEQRVRPWCSGAIPNIYAFVQAQYWKVGFLKYYKLAQLPNFILAAPTACFSAAGIWTYMRSDWAWSLSGGLLHRKLIWRKRPYYSRALLPHVYLWTLMLVYTLLVVHVQIITRLFMFMPIVCWFHAHLYYMAERHLARRRLHLGILGTYICVTSLLFFSFYPPA